MVKGAKDIIYGDEARLKIKAGVSKAYEMVSSTYGPLATNVLLGKEWGAPVLTRDGVTVAKDIVLPDPFENEAAQLVKQASETTNRLAGDGTTLTVVLTHHLVDAAMKRITFGENPMLIRKQINDALKDITRFVVEQRKDVTDENLEQVATVSSGDPALGKLIAEALVEVGERGGIMVEEHDAVGVKLDYVNGFHFNAGTYAIDKLKLQFAPTLVLVTERPLSANSDILPILQYVAEHPETKRVVIIGEVTGDAAQTFVLNQQKGLYDGCAIMPGIAGIAKEWFFEDLAKYCGCKVVKPGASLDNKPNSEGVKPIAQYFGTADKVIVTDNSTTVFGGGGADEDLKIHADAVEGMLKEETNDYKVEQLELRLNRLTGKIATIKVGAATQVEREELRYRVDDAVQAARAAREGGVVPGGATTLLRASTLTTIPKFIADALQQPFIKLMENGAEKGDHRLMQVLGSKAGYGFNLRDMTDKPVDLFKAGVVDPTKVIVQAITNASSVAGNLITTGCMSVPIPVEEDKKA